MSLLDQLAFYSCKFDSLFPELTHHLPNNPKSTKSKQINIHTPKSMSNVSEQSFSTDFSWSRQLHIEQLQQSKGGNVSVDASLIQKCSRLSWIGSMIDKKIRKLKYEFIIYLTNIKTHKVKENDKQNKSCIFSPEQPRQANQMQSDSEKKEGKVQIVNNSSDKVDQVRFCMKRSQNQSRREMKPVKNIKIKQLKSSDDMMKQQQPLVPITQFSSERQHSTLVPVSVVQMTQAENPDLYYIIDIFLKQEMQKVGGKEKLIIHQSPKLIRSAQCDFQKQFRNSQTKRLEEFQFTALPMSPQQKRRLSHTTIFSGTLSDSVWMSCEQQKQKKIFERKSSLKERIPQDANMGKTEQLRKKQSQVAQQQMSQNKNSLFFRKSFCEGQNLQKSTLFLRQSEINQQYSKGLEKYIEFRRTIEKRRESTLKQIEDSQQLIAKLIRSFKSNKKANSTKRNQKQSKEKKYSSTKKAANPDKRMSSKNKINYRQKEAEISMVDNKSLFTERNMDLNQQETSLKTIEVFCNYVKQKQKMDSNKQSPNKARGQRTNHCLSTAAKKQSKKSNNTCKNVGKKQPRVELRVEIGLKPVKEKKQLKNNPKKNPTGRTLQIKNTQKS